MVRAKSPVFVPASFEEKPFEIKDEISIFNGAMIYSGRHPAPRFLKDGSLSDRLNFLRAGVLDSAKAGVRAEARLSWDVLHEIINRIERNEIIPTRCAFDAHGKLDPVRTRIRTSDLAELAIERGERPTYLKHLLGRMVDQAKSSPFTPRTAHEFVTKFIADEEAAGRRPTLIRLEQAASKTNKRGGRIYLRRAFHQIKGPVKRGRPANGPTKFAKK
jgi:hypothetical protein